MAKCGQTAAQFITETFRPRVAVMAAPEVEAICMKNDLTLTELLQPFSKVNQDGEWAADVRPEIRDQTLEDGCSTAHVDLFANICLDLGHAVV